MNRRVLAVVASVVFAAAAIAPAASNASGTERRSDPPGITWWAFGDSYSSGEGLRYNDFEANPPDTNCERATGRSSVKAVSRAYSVVAKDQLSGIDDFRVLACTGAITNDWRAQWSETGNRRADLVTLSFGGNNVGFSDVVMACVGLSVEGGINAVAGGTLLWGLNPALGCEVSREEIDRRVDMLVGNGPDPHEAFDSSQTLPDMYAEIAAEAVTPGGHVMVLGYPNIVEESGRWTWRLLSGNRCHRIRRADASMLRGATAYLNQQIGAAVEAANDNPYGVTFHFVDVSQIYEGANGRHGLCTGEPWLNGLTVGVLGPDDGPVPIRAYRSFHPNQLGHNATGDAVAEEIRGLDWSSLAPDPVDVDRTAFVGAWTGSISGPTGLFLADITLAIEGGVLTGTVSHPDVPCFGTTREVDLVGDQLLLETAYTDDSVCIKGGTHRLTAVGADELRYEWLSPDSARIDAGTLRRAAPSEPAPPDGTADITTSAPGSRSTYVSDDAYSVEVTSVVARGGFLVDVGFSATGPADLRRPEGGCLVNDEGFIATPVAQTLTVDQDGSYAGTWTYALVRPGSWSLQYSCRSDYTLASVADVRISDVDVSRYSSRYYATVLGVSRPAPGTVEVRFASHGDEGTQGDLRHPDTSCLVADGRAILASNVALVEEISGEFYDGTIRFDFVPDTALTFVYSCENDYTEVPLS